MLHTSKPRDQLRLEREWILARYDGEKVSVAIFAVLKALETDISWMDHKRMGERQCTS